MNYQLRRADCSREIRADISNKSFSKKPRKSSETIAKWSAEKTFGEWLNENQNGHMLPTGQGYAPQVVMSLNGIA